jgi:hypothetical protein
LKLLTVLFARSMAIKLDNFRQKFDLIAPKWCFTSMVALDDGVKILTSSSMGFQNVFQTDLVEIIGETGVALQSSQYNK